MTLSVMIYRTSPPFNDLLITPITSCYKLPNPNWDILKYVPKKGSECPYHTENVLNLPPSIRPQFPLMLIFGLKMSLFHQLDPNCPLRLKMSLLLTKL